VDLEEYNFSLRYREPLLLEMRYAAKLEWAREGKPKTSARAMRW